MTAVLILSFFPNNTGQRLGRKRTTALGQAVTITGATIQAASYGLGQMITARIITGVGVGILTATVPIWSVCLCTVAKKNIQ